MHAKSPNAHWIKVIGMLGAAGLVLSIWLTHVHVKVHTDPLYTPICAINDQVSCETVAISKYAVLLGVPVSIWGILSYLILFALLRVEAFKKRDGGAAGVIALYGLLLAACAVGLAIVSVLVIKSLCPLCLAVYLINFLIAGFSLGLVRRRGGVRACVAREMKRVVSNPFPFVLHGLVGLLLAVGLQIFLPGYWRFASVYGDFTIPSGFDENGAPWLGAKSPRLIIHEYLDYECPACKIAHFKLRRLLNQGHWDEVRLVRHDYQRMSCLSPDHSVPSKRCMLARAAHCAGRQGRFWEWNAAVFAQPKPTKFPQRKTYESDLARALGLDVQRFGTCLVDPKTIDYVQGVFRDAKKNKVFGTPTYIVNGEKMRLKEVFDLIR